MSSPAVSKGPASSLPPPSLPPLRRWVGWTSLCGKSEFFKVSGRNLFVRGFPYSISGKEFTGSPGLRFERSASSDRVRLYDRVCDPRPQLIGPEEVGEASRLRLGCREGNGFINYPFISQFFSQIFCSFLPFFSLYPSTSRTSVLTTELADL